MEHAIQTILEEVRKRLRRFIESVRLWWLIPMRFIGIPVFLLGLGISAVGGMYSGIIQTGVTWLGLIFTVSSVGFWLVSFLAPVAVYKERQRIPKSAPWFPSRWYYFMIFPTGLLGLLLSIVYTNRRLNYYGNTQVPQGESKKEEGSDSPEDLIKGKDPYLQEEIRANVNGSGEAED